MGRDLHYTILQFIERNLSSHAKVASWKRMDTPQDDDYIYLIIRTDGFSDVIVHASDEYRYTLTHYYQKPAQITAGGFILIAKPEGGYSYDIVEIAQNDKISIGKWGALMGALYHDNHWNYIPKERREDD